MKTVLPAPPGFFESFSTLGESLLGTVHDRFELFSVELQEEKFRLIQIFVWISAAVFSGMMAITFASITLVYLFWDSARLTVLGSLTILYCAALFVIIAAFRRHLASHPKPFEGTRQELSEDRACIRKLS